MKTRRGINVGVFVSAVLVPLVGVANTYEYDQLHRLTRATFDDGSVVYYVYDAVGNRTVRVMNPDAETVYVDVGVEPPWAGVVTRDPEMTWYPIGTAIELTAEPEGACTFSGWTGDVPAGHESDNPLSIVADAYKSLTAHFATPLGDADGDCDLDVGDFGDFQVCFGESPVPPGCAAFDFDASGVVDLADFSAFAAGFTGP